MLERIVRGLFIFVFLVFFVKWVVVLYLYSEYWFMSYDKRILYMGFVMFVIVDDILIFVKIYEVGWVFGVIKGIMMIIRVLFIIWGRSYME